MLRAAAGVRRAGSTASAVLAAALLAFPGASQGSASGTTCRAQAEKVAGWGEAMLLHYDGGVSVYPADMSYLLLRDGLAVYGRRGCAPRILGAALERELTPSQRKRLLSLLPRSIERTLRRALAASG